jgi:RNA polymerase sigma-70 factor, ECF subfamily
VSAQMELTHKVEQLYHEHYESVYRYLLLTGSTPADADEFTQEAFLRLFRALKSGQHLDRPRSWLMSVARYARVEAPQRRDEREVSLSETHYALQVDPVLDPETAMLEREKLDRVRSAMSRLTERQAEYLHLRAEGLKLREIADLYGVAVQSVAEACSRAVERLAEVAHE